ncbi:MAG TPA: alpha/beta fold hydrolase [Terriglobia bacterium]|nr:alpha/beta fold hydrolase [Terriglobia bacterium]
MPIRTRRARSRAGRPWRWALALAVLAAGVYLGIGIVAATVLTTPQRHFSGDITPDTYHASYQAVRFMARGGDVEISAWYIPRSQSHQAVVLVHGKDASRTDEFDGRFVEFAATLASATGSQTAQGFAVLMIDLRGHGRSGNARMTFGPAEARDIEGAADWVKTQGFQAGSIGVLGVSMGAAAAIYAAAGDPDINAVVEDSGYAAVYPLVQARWRKASHLPNFFLPGTLFVGRLLFADDVRQVRPVDQIGRIPPRAVLIIHGTADTLVPIENARALKAADPSAEMWEVAGANHAGAYAANPSAYVQRVAQFFNQSLR